MRSKTILALVLLNVLLLASLCFRNLLVSTASAQSSRLPAPSEYLIVSGKAQAAPNGVLYILDERNQLLAVRTLNQQKIVDFQPIDLSKVFK